MAKAKKAKAKAKAKTKTKEEKRFFVRDALDGGFWEIVDGKLVRVEIEEVEKIILARREIFLKKLGGLLDELDATDRELIESRLRGQNVAGSQDAAMCNPNLVAYGGCIAGNIPDLPCNPMATQIIPNCTTSCHFLAGKIGYISPCPMSSPHIPDCDYCFALAKVAYDPCTQKAAYLPCLKCNITAPDGGCVGCHQGHTIPTCGSVEVYGKSQNEQEQPITASGCVKLLKFSNDLIVIKTNSVATIGVDFGPLWTAIQGHTHPECETLANANMLRNRVIVLESRKNVLTIDSDVDINTAGNPPYKYSLAALTCAYDKIHVSVWGVFGDVANSTEFNDWQQLRFTWSVDTNKLLSLRVWSQAGAECEPHVAGWEDKTLHLKITAVG